MAKFFSIHPKMHTLMLGANVFSQTKSNGQTFTSIALAIQVWNTGKPSIVTDWSLAVIPQGKIPVIAPLIQTPELLKIGGKYNSLVLRGADALDSKLKISKVTTDLITGTLLFCVDLPQDIVLNGNTRFELTATDLYGNQSPPSVKYIRDWPNDGAFPN
jgi:hypothetical protein